MSDHCDFDVPIPSPRLQGAVDKALDVLGQEAKDALLAHLRSGGINLGDGSQRTLNDLNAALESIFSKDATAFIMEMIWKNLN
nr:hypothetical protein Josef01_02j05_33 [uncultured archaeon]